MGQGGKFFSVFLFGGAGAHADILFLLDHADEFQHEFKLGVGNGGLAASPAAASPAAAAALLIVVYQFGPMAQSGGIQAGLVNGAGCDCVQDIAVHQVQLLPEGESVHLVVQVAVNALPGA